MKIYIEPIEELTGSGVSTYSLVQGMEMYRGEVRASGVEIFERDAHENNGDPMDAQDEKRNELVTALVNEIYKEYK